MQFMNFLPHSAQKASQTQGIQNHQTWEKEEIQWNKRGEEGGGQEWVQLLNYSLPLVCSPRPPQKKRNPEFTECGDSSLSNIGFEWCDILESHSQHSALETCTTSVSLGAETRCCLSCRYREQGKENPACVDCGSLKTAHLTLADPLYCLELREGNMLFVVVRENRLNLYIT